MDDDKDDDQDDEATASASRNQRAKDRRKIVRSTKYAYNPAVALPSSDMLALERDGRKLTLNRLLQQRLSQIVGDDLFTVMLGTFRATWTSPRGPSLNPFGTEAKSHNKLFLLHFRLSMMHGLDLRQFVIPRCLSVAIFKELRKASNKLWEMETCCWERAAHECFTDDEKGRAYRAISLPLVFLHNCYHAYEVNEGCTIEGRFVEIDPTWYLLQNFFRQREELMAAAMFSSLEW